MSQTSFERETAAYQSASFAQQMHLYRGRLLSLMLALVGTLLPVLFGAYLWRFWEWPVLRWIYLSLLTLSFLLGWGRVLLPLSYPVRVFALLGLVYLMAIYAALFYGNMSEANLSFLFAVLSGALFLSGWALIFNSILALSLHILATYMVLDRGITLSRLAHVPQRVLLGPTQWLFSSAAFFIASAGVIGLWYFIQKRFETTLEDTIQLSTILEQEHRRLTQREHLLRRRVRQIQAASEIVNTLGSITEPEKLMHEVVNQIQRHFGLYYVGIFLVDEDFEFALLRAGSGEAGERMVGEGYRLPLGGASMIAWAITHQEPRVSLNVKQEPMHYENPYLPYTRSELALPLIARGEVLGAMTIQSDRPNAFDEEDIRTLQTLANSVALALSNALILQRLQSQLREIEALQQRLLGRTWGELSQGLIVRREAASLHLMSSPTPEAGEQEPLVLPIRLYNQTIGEVRIVNLRPWREGEAELLEGLVALLTNHLMVARLLDEVQQYAQREEVQNRLTSRFASALDFDLLVRSALEGLSDEFQVQEAWLLLDVFAGEEASASGVPASQEPSSGGEAA